MPDSPSFDQSPNENQPAERVRFPGTVTVAGVWWMLLGLFCAFGSVAGAVFVLSLEAQQQRPPQADAGLTCSVWLGVVMGVWAFISGLRLTQGKSRDVLVTAIISTMIGLLYLAFACTLFFTIFNGAMNRQPQIEIILTISAMVGAVMGCVFLLPAGLAFAARRRYLAWQTFMNPPRTRPERRRRRRRYEDDYDDDSPRRRRRYEDDEDDRDDSRRRRRYEDDDDRDDSPRRSRDD